MTSAHLAIIDYKSISIEHKDGFVEQVKSSRSKEVKRKSHIVEIEDFDGNKIAEIVKFFTLARVERKERSKQIEEVLGIEDRFALVHIFKAQVQPNGYFRMDYNTDINSYEEKFKVIPVTSIIGKVFGAIYSNETLRAVGIESNSNHRIVFKPHEKHYQFL